MSAYGWEDIIFLLEENYRLRREVANLRSRLNRAEEIQPQGDREADSAPISYVSKGLYQGASNSSSEQRFLVSHTLQDRQTSTQVTGSIDNAPLSLTGVTSPIAAGGSEGEVGMLPQRPGGPGERSIRNLSSGLNQETSTVCAGQGGDVQPGSRCQKVTLSMEEPLGCSRRNSIQTPSQHLLHGLAVQLKSSVTGSKPMQAGLQLPAGSVRSLPSQVTSTPADPSVPEDIPIQGQHGPPYIVKVQSLADVLPLCQSGSETAYSAENATVIDFPEPPGLFKQPLADVSPSTLETDSGRVGDDSASSSTMLYPTAEDSEATETTEMHYESRNLKDKATDITTTIKTLSRRCDTTEAAPEAPPKEAKKALSRQSLIKHFRIKPYILNCSIQDKLFSSEGEDMVEISPGSGVLVAKTVFQSPSARASVHGMARVLLLHLFSVEELLKSSITGRTRRRRFRKVVKPGLDPCKIAAIIDAVQTTFGGNANRSSITRTLQNVLGGIKTALQKHVTSS